MSVVNVAVYDPISNSAATPQGDYRDLLLVRCCYLDHSSCTTPHNDDHIRRVRGQKVSCVAYSRRNYCVAVRVRRGFIILRYDTDYETSSILSTLAGGFHHSSQSTGKKHGASFRNL